MATFSCESHPRLKVNTPGGRVNFVDGVATAEGVAADALRSLAAQFGITETSTPEVRDEPKPDPKPRARRAS